MRFALIFNFTLTEGIKNKFHKMRFAGFKQKLYVIEFHFLFCFARQEDDLEELGPAIKPPQAKVKKDKHHKHRHKRDRRRDSDKEHRKGTGHEKNSADYHKGDHNALRPKSKWNDQVMLVSYKSFPEVTC